MSGSELTKRIQKLDLRPEEKILKLDGKGRNLIYADFMKVIKQVFWKRFDRTQRNFLLYQQLIPFFSHISIHFEGINDDTEKKAHKLRQRLNTSHKTQQVDESLLKQCFPTMIISGHLDDNEDDDGNASNVPKYEDVTFDVLLSVFEVVVANRKSTQQKNKIKGMNVDSVTGRTLPAKVYNQDGLSSGVDSQGKSQLNDDRTSKKPGSDCFTTLQDRGETKNDKAIAFDSGSLRRCEGAPKTKQHTTSQLHDDTSARTQGSAETMIWEHLTDSQCSAGVSKRIFDDMWSSIKPNLKNGIGLYNSQFHSGQIGRSLSELEKAQPGQNREDWAKHWAVQLSNNTAEAWRLNLHRKLCLKFLYALIDDDLLMSFEPKSVDRIVRCCLVMDRASALYNMINSTTNIRGLHWFAEKDRTLMKGQLNDEEARCLRNARAPLNRRLRDLFDDERLGYHKDPEISRWMQPQRARNEENLGGQERGGRVNATLKGGSVPQILEIVMPNEANQKGQERSDTNKIDGNSDGGMDELTSDGGIETNWMQKCKKLWNKTVADLADDADVDRYIFQYGFGHVGQSLTRLGNARIVNDCDYFRSAQFCMDQMLCVAFLRRLQDRKLLIGFKKYRIDRIKILAGKSNSEAGASALSSSSDVSEITGTFVRHSLLSDEDMMLGEASFSCDVLSDVSAMSIGSSELTFYPDYSNSGGSYSIPDLPFDIVESLWDG